MGEAAPALAFPELVLGRYRPFRPLGSGGSGSVWLARDEQTGLDVALKIIAREGKAAVRAEREAAAAAQLRHPACLRSYGFAHDERHVYIAYEFIPGRTFREALRARELGDEAAIEACAQVCDGLAHAHAAGILHRDIKPSNVLLAEGECVSARVLDFGLAQMAEAETLTEQGDVPGTLAYISPERLAGKPATAAADVWAVGVMLWEALAGRHPFWRGSMLETARAIESGARPLGDVRPGLPKRLLRLVDRALAQDPTRRPSARELAEELRGLAGVPAHSRRPRSVSLGTPPGAGRFAGAALAGVFAGWTAAALPFFPGGWSVGIGLAVAALTVARERAGLALALAVPILPLGNVSSGLALLYAALAAIWLLITWKEPRATLLFALGPLLAPLAALGLLPLATVKVGSAPRRALVVVLGVLTAALAAGIRHASLPLIGGAAPLGVGVGASTGPLDVAGSLARAAAAQPSLLVEAAVLALVAVALPHARRFGLWGAAGIGAGMLGVTVLALPGGAPLLLVASLVVCAWAIAGFTALRSH
ncbi:MAG TPA: serine/threonine-protein kinase [Gaiellaceae bacterium]|nr:serine/threonine-protein kinase [Gaiellaceae bacterium]